MLVTSEVAVGAGSDITAELTMRSTVVHASPSVVLRLRYFRLVLPREEPNLSIKCHSEQHRLAVHVRCTHRYI